MSPIRTFGAISALFVMLTAPLAVQAFDKVTSKDQFVQLVEGKDLKLTGITVNVTPSGQIKGRAYGFGVSGQWQWRDGYFCRSLYWGKTDLGPNCQQVEVQGNTIRFTSDRGTGQFADLRMR